MPSRDTIVTHMVKVLLDMHGQQDTRPVAKSLRTFILSHSIIVPNNAMRYLDKVCERPRVAAMSTTQKRLSHKRTFALLNPMLWTAKKINYAVYKRFGSEGWVANKRAAARKEVPEQEKSDVLIRNMAHPIEPNRGYYYMESPDCNQDHLRTVFYVFHAQAWAMRLFADRLIEFYGDSYACPYCERNAAQLRTASQQPHYLLAYEWTKHNPVDRKISLLVPLGPDNTHYIQDYTPAEWDECIQVEAERFGQAKSLSVMSQRVFVQPSPQQQAINTANATTAEQDAAQRIIDELDEAVSTPIPNLQPISR